MLDVGLLVVPIITALIWGLFRFLTYVVALWGSEPKERPAILRALAQCHKWWQKPG